jgi:hypothetical protein
MREVLRRIRRAGLLLAGIFAVLVAANLLVRFDFLTWIMAISAAVLSSFLSLFWPTRIPAEASDALQTARLDELAARAADVLRDRHDDFPGQAVSAVDAIIARLRELAPHLGEIDANSTLAGDARRLICQHLPQLLDAYFELPPRARGRRSENSQRLADSLQIIADELDHLLEQHQRNRNTKFETQHRFIQSRYGEDERLKGN